MNARLTPIRREQAVLLGLCGSAALGCVLGLAFPPAAHPSTGLAAQAFSLVRVLCTAALVAVLLLAPGLILRMAPGRRRVALGFVPLPGLALLATTGCLAWLLAPNVSPRASSAVVLVPVLGWLAARIARSDPSELIPPNERWALLVTAAGVGVATARALWSLGPSGELGAGFVSRTLEVGDRPDSGISYGVVQLVAHGTSPFSGIAHSYFYPYDFSARGPLAGLASAPIVLLAGGRPPVGATHQPWVPFDAQGFMAYRLAMMAFAGTAFLSVWTLTQRLMGLRSARLALLLAVTTPFLVHEVWFTWPKLLAASLVLLSATTLLEGRPVWGGLLMGAAYLVHPVALISLPALALLALWPLVGARLRAPRLAPTLQVLAGVAACVLFWRLVNGSHYKQSDFLHYVTEAGRQRYFSAQLLRALGGHPGAVTIGAWLSDRFVSLSNTLVPLRLLFFSANDPSINVTRACYPFCTGHSPLVVHFFFQYWTGLPFGIGIVFFPLLLQSLWRAARKWPWAITVAVIVPFLVFLIYWGDASTGLLREGLQTWVLTLCVVVAVEQSPLFGWLRSAPIRGLVALRSVEVLAVAIVPTIATTGRVVAHRFYLTDVVALLAMTILSGWLGILVFKERAPMLTHA